MPVNFIQERKRQKFLVPIVLAVFGVTLLVLWFGYFRGGEIPAPPAVQPGQIKIKIDLGVLENPFLKEIQPFPAVPTPESGQGRENPFLPY